MDKDKDTGTDKDYGCSRGGVVKRLLLLLLLLLLGQNLVLSTSQPSCLPLLSIGQHLHLLARARILLLLLLLLLRLLLLPGIRS